MNECSKACDGMAIKNQANQARPDPTLGEHLDQQIARARKNLEEACIVKAKAEAMQMLNIPMSFVHQIGYPF